jgi:hypothetical protein
MGKKRGGQALPGGNLIALKDDNPKERLLSLALILNSLDDVDNLDNSFSGNVSANDRISIADLNPEDDKQRHRIIVR